MRKKERNKKRYVKIFVILVSDAGHSGEEVADILGLDGAAIYRYVAVYQHVGVEDHLNEN